MEAHKVFTVTTLPSEHAFKMNISSDDEVTPLGGVEYNFLNLLSKCMDFTYKVVIPADGEFGSQKQNGEWSGMVGLAKRGEADFGLNMIALTYFRNEAVNFSYPYMIDGATFFTKMPELLPKTLAFLYPFDRFLWLCLIAVLIAVPFAFKFLLERYSLLRLYFEIFGSFFQQPLNLKMPRISQSILCAGWFFYSRFAVMCYSVLLLSFLTFPIMTRGIYTVKEVAEAAAKGTHKCYVFGGTADQEAFYTAKGGPLYIIGKTIKQYNRLLKHGGHITEYIPDSKSILIGTSILVPFNYMAGVYQKYFKSSENFYITLFAIPVKETFCCLKQMNDCIFRMFAAGLYQKFLADELYLLNLMSHSKHDPEEEHSILGIYDLCGAFLILLGGLFASIVCLLVERFHYSKKQNKRNGRMKIKNKTKTQSRINKRVSTITN